MDVAIKQVGAIDLAALIGDNADAVANVSAGVWREICEEYMYNGASWDRARTPNVFKSLSAVVITSETTIWTPAGRAKNSGSWASSSRRVSRPAP
jgi:hypothetical protein